MKLTLFSRIDQGGAGAGADLSELAVASPVPHDLSGRAGGGGGGPPENTWRLIVAGCDKKLGKSIKTSACSISSCAGINAEAPALGKVAHEGDVNPTVVESQ